MHGLQVRCHKVCVTARHLKRAVPEGLLPIENAVLAPGLRMISKSHVGSLRPKKLRATSPKKTGPIFSRSNGGRLKAD